VGSQGALLTGMWNQGSPVPLNFSRDTFVFAAKASAVDGIWLGTLRDGSKSLRYSSSSKATSRAKSSVPTTVWISAQWD
jgi:hypothetical protein